MAAATTGEWYIHIADPGFPEPPWPGERRLGPYPTHEEALAQAVEDAAGGYAIAVGVYSAEESLKRLENTARNKGKAQHTHSDIARKGDVRARQILKANHAQLQWDADQLKAMLPPGTTLQDALALLAANRETVAAAQRVLDDASAQAAAAATIADEARAGR